MTEMRTAVITGASRGLGLASAELLYRRGWRVVAANRSPDAGMAALRNATGAADGDPRLVSVQLDLADPDSVGAAATAIGAQVGAPDALIHNAGVAASGFVEETPLRIWHELFSTNLFGPVALTNALLPAMRSAGRGRIVLVASETGIRGMTGMAVYAATKASIERWGEALAGEIAPFGLGVSVLVAGSFDTEIITDKTPVYWDPQGDYAAQFSTYDRRARATVRFAKSPDKFAKALVKALDDRGAYRRRALGADAQMILLINRILPGRALHELFRRTLGQPAFGSLRARQAPKPLSDGSLDEGDS